MRYSQFTIFIVPMFLAAFPVASHDDRKPGGVSAVLKAKDFWEKAGKQNGRQWSDTDQKQLEELKTTAKDGVIRLRANKVLVDLAGNGRIRSEDDEAAVIECFRYLEKEIASAPVKMLCADQGFTHYTGPVGSGGTFLIEHVQPGGFHGGLNLKWDSAKKAVVEVKAWGDVPAK